MPTFQDFEAHWKTLEFSWFSLFLTIAMGGKRKSQGGDSGKKNRRIEDCLEGAQALLSGAQKSVKTFNEWLSKPEYLLILAVL